MPRVAWQMSMVGGILLTLHVSLRLSNPSLKLRGIDIRIPNYINPSRNEGRWQRRAPLLCGLSLIEHGLSSVFPLVLEIILWNSCYVDLGRQLMRPPREHVGPGRQQRSLPPRCQLLSSHFLGEAKVLFLFVVDLTPLIAWSNPIGTRSVSLRTFISSRLLAAPSPTPATRVSKQGSRSRSSWMEERK